MTNRTSIRDDLVNLIEDKWPWANVPVKHENTGAIELDKMPDLWAYCYIDFTSTVQANISHTPFKRYFGNLAVRLCFREGNGTRKLLEHFDELESILEFKTFGGIHLGVCHVEPVKAPEGWDWREMLVPFFADSNT